MNDYTDIPEYIQMLAMIKRQEEEQRMKEARITAFAAFCDSTLREEREKGEKR